MLAEQPPSAPASLPELLLLEELPDALLVDPLVLPDVLPLLVPDVDPLPELLVPEPLAEVLPQDPAALPPEVEPLLPPDPELADGPSLRSDPVSAASFPASPASAAMLKSSESSAGHPASTTAIGANARVNRLARR
jgi:hypothetical protein